MQEKIVRFRKEVRKVGRGYPLVERGNCFKLIKALIDEIRFCKPHCACPNCKGDVFRGCYLCSGRGWLLIEEWEAWDENDKPPEVSS